MALNIPDEIMPGDTLKFTEQLAEYCPADGWSMNYMIGNEHRRYRITSIADGNKFVFEAEASTTKRWLPGDYRFQAQVVNEPERHTVGTGIVTIKKSLFLSSELSSDYLTKIISALEAAILGVATKGQKSLQIRNKAIEHMSLTEMKRVLDEYKRERQNQLKAEKLADGGRMGGNMILARFK